MARSRLMLTAAALALTLTRPASAGIADSPLPTLVAGKTTNHVYSVAGVVSEPGIQTFFSCTSTDTVPMQIGVELFPSPGGGPCNDATASSLTVNPGATVLFSSNGGAAWIGIDSSLGGCTSKGSARILSTSKKLVCTVYVADSANYPPTSMVYLTIVSKLKQRGE